MLLKPVWFVWWDDVRFAWMGLYSLVQQPSLARALFSSLPMRRMRMVLAKETKRNYYTSLVRGRRANLRAVHFHSVSTK